MDYVLETNRLRMRPFLLGDAPCFYHLNADPEVIRHTGDASFRDEEEARQFILDYDKYRKYGYGRWTLLLKDKDDFAGWCGLNYNEDKGETDLGFRLSRSFWNRGYATEAAMACIDNGFEKLKLKRIIGRALKVNTASIRVLEKAGMKYEREFEAHGSKAVLYSIENSF